MFTIEVHTWDKGAPVVLRSYEVEGTHADVAYRAHWLAADLNVDYCLWIKRGDKVVGILNIQGDGRRYIDWK